MSDESNGNSLPEENTSPEENMPPAQENFGPPFPEEPPVTPPQPPIYENPPDAFYGMPPYGTPIYGYGVPPAGTYGAPYDPGVPPRPGNPIPLGEAIRQLPRQYWRVLSKPGAATFAEEQGKAAWNIVWAQLFILGAIQALAILVTFNISLPFQLSLFSGGMSNAPGTANPAEIIQIYRILSIPLALGSLVVTPFLALGGAGINHLIAKLFRGQGTFLPYCYSYLLLYVPLSFLGSWLALIPFVGSFLALPIAIYEIVLMVFMTMAVHRLSGGRATLAVLLLPILLFLIAFIVGVALFAVLVISLQNLH